jgi:hypothetical protein
VALREAGRNLLAAGADHHRRTHGTERFGGRKDVAEHRTAGKLVQHLGQRRTHPGALAGCQHDHGCRRGV